VVGEATASAFLVETKKRWPTGETGEVVTFSEKFLLSMLAMS